MGITSAPGTSLATSAYASTQGWARAISTPFNSIQNSTFYLLSAYPCQVLRAMLWGYKMKTLALALRELLV